MTQFQAIWEQIEICIFLRAYFKQLLLFTAFQYACHFRNIKGQRFDVLAPKIPYHVTNYLNNGLMSLIYTIERIPLLIHGVLPCIHVLFFFSYVQSIYCKLQHDHNCCDD